MIYRIIQKRNIFLTISGILVAASIFSLFFWGLNFGIDFIGGSLSEVEFKNYQPTITQVQDSLKGVNLHNLVIQPTANNTVILRFKDTSEKTHQLMLTRMRQSIKDKKGASLKELRFDSVGPSIGQELKSKSFNAAFLVLLMVIIYISFAFRRVSRPVTSWKYGAAAIIALMHDVLITLGVFAVLGHFYGIEVNTPFIAAILTVLGYSVSDTIVVFDRIRENLPKTNEDFENTVNLSINQTLTRSINTSLSAILALLSIFFFGGETIRSFALALTIGIFVGTYSSIFLASPMLVIWERMTRKNK